MLQSDIHFITTSSELAAACKQIVAATHDEPYNFVTMDTEFIRTKTYFPQLALIQIGIPHHAFVIDYVRLKRKGTRPLLEILCSDNIVKVFHASRQDCEVLLHIFHKLPFPLFDTQIAAGLLGFGASVGYETLVQRLLGISLDKGCQRSPWLDRPLTEEQIMYAAHDVCYLADVYLALVEQLRQSDRLSWAASENLALLNRDLYETDGATYWQKFPLIRSQWKAAYILKHLTAWREAKAILLDRPRTHVLSDQALFELALRKDLFTADLRSIFHTLSPSAKHRLSVELWEKKDLFISLTRLLRQLETNLRTETQMIKESMQAVLPYKNSRDEISHMYHLREKLKKVCNKCAKKYNIAEPLFMSRHHFDLWIKGIEKTRNPFLTSSNLSRGWRKELLKNYAEEIYHILHEVFNA